MTDLDDTPEANRKFKVGDLVCLKYDGHRFNAVGRRVAVTITGPTEEIADINHPMVLFTSGQRAHYMKIAKV